MENSCKSDNLNSEINKLELDSFHQLKTRRVIEISDFLRRNNLW